MLSTTDPMGLRVKPPGTAIAVKHTICKWILFWETLELHRIILQKEAEFNASYLSTFLGAVPLARRLAILEERQKAVVLGGDATPDMLFWINWGTLEAVHPVDHCATVGHLAVPSPRRC